MKEFGRNVGKNDGGAESTWKVIQRKAKGQRAGSGEMKGEGGWTGIERKREKKWEDRLKMGTNQKERAGERH